MIVTSFSDHENKIIFLQGSVYRALGEFWNSEKSYSVAFVWWIRAAHKFALVGDERLARISLGSARDSAEKIKYGYEIDDVLGEYQGLISEIDNDIYKIEKELLDKEVKSALERKLQT